MLLFILLSAAQPPPPWRLDQNKDGVKIERRQVLGSSFEELRISTTSTRPMSALCDALWGKHIPSKPEADFKKRIVLKETETERLTYEQVRIPIFTDRDYVMHVKLVAGASTGRCELEFGSVDDPHYPPDKDHVQIPSIRGRWTLVPTADGKVGVSYVVFGDPGGSIPAFLARGAQRSTAVKFLKVVLARAGAAPAR